jgi:anti-sigma factor RsiW
VSTDPGLLVDCVDVVELVTDYLEGALDPTTSEQVAAHLALCEGCDRYLEQMRATIRALGHVPLETVSDEARSTLLAAFQDRPA